MFIVNFCVYISIHKCVKHTLKSLTPQLKQSNGEMSETFIVYVPQYNVFKLFTFFNVKTRRVTKLNEFQMISGLIERS